MVKPKQARVQEAKDALKLAQDSLAKKQASLRKVGKWSSYDRTWFSGPDEQEVLVLILKVLKITEKLHELFYSSGSHTVKSALTWGPEIGVCIRQMAV
jgi:hypothetical protein